MNMELSVDMETIIIRKIHLRCCEKINKIENALFLITIFTFFVINYWIVLPLQDLLKAPKPKTPELGVSGLKCYEAF